MSDQSPPPQPRPRPRPAPQAPSRESRFIGYLVLGFGALAVVAMLMIAFDRPSDSVELTAEQSSLQEELSDTVTTPTQQSAPKQEKKLYIKRQKSIDEGDLQGGWEAMIGNNIAVLQIQKGAFQVIVASPDPQIPRRYFTGTYQIVDDLFVMKPRFDWGEPKKTPGSKIVYKRLTSSPFPMIVGFDGGDMVWQNAPTSEQRMYVPSRSPLLSGSKEDYIVWKRSK